MWFVLAVVLAFLLVLVLGPKQYSAALSGPETTLTFLTDLIGPDMTKYKAELSNYDSTKLTKLSCSNSKFVDTCL